MTRVLPLPAPAKTRSGPRVCAAAAAWGSLSSASSIVGKVSVRAAAPQGPLLVICRRKMHVGQPSSLHVGAERVNEDLHDVEPGRRSVIVVGADLRQSLETLLYGLAFAGIEIEMSVPVVRRLE